MTDDEINMSDEEINIELSKCRDRHAELMRLKRELYPVDTKPRTPEELEEKLKNFRFMMRTQAEDATRIFHPQNVAEVFEELGRQLRKYDKRCEQLEHGELN